MGARCDSAQNVCCSQRSKAHMLLPSLRSTDMPNVAPQLRPGGSFAQPSSRRYGFGAALGPGTPCGKAGAAENASAAATATISAPPACCTYRMMLLRFGGLSSFQGPAPKPGAARRLGHTGLAHDGFGFHTNLPGNLVGITLLEFRQEKF